MQASEGHTHSHQTRNIPLDIVWWIYPMHHGPVLGRRAKHTQCKDGGARMARALQAEGGDGLVAGLAGRPRSNGLRWAGAPHSSAPRSSCCRKHMLQPSPSGRSRRTSRPSFLRSRAQ